MDKDKYSEKEPDYEVKETATNEPICGRPLDTVDWEVGENCTENKHTGKSGLCIFHAPIEEKSSIEDEEAFWDEFERYVREKENDGDSEDIDCRYFIFPEDYGFFSGVEFKKRFNFSRSVFKGKIDFDTTYFRQGAIFTEAVFEGETILLSARFGINANFYKAVFRGPVRAGDICFKDRASFLESTFEKRLRFVTDCEGSEITFDGTIFNDEAYFKVERAKSFSLDRVKTLDKGIIIIESTNLSNWGFANATPLVEALFYNVEWPKDKKGKRKIIFDETRAKTGDITYETAAEVYRRLRKNFENRLAYSEAGDFHIGEMEMRRLGLREKGWKRFFNLTWLFLHLYRVFGGYGERIRNPIISFLAVGFAFAGLWSLLGFPIPEGETVTISHNFGYAVLFSFKTFFTLPGKAFCLIQELVGALQRAAGVGIITLFILALRRAFRR